MIVRSGSANKKKYTVENGLLRPCLEDVYSIKESIVEYRLDRLSKVTVISNDDDVNKPSFEVRLDFIDCSSVLAAMSMTELNAVNVIAKNNKKNVPWSSNWNELNAYIERSLNDNEKNLVLKKRWYSKNKKHSILSFSPIIIGFLLLLAFKDSHSISVIFILIGLLLSVMEFAIQLQRKAPNEELELQKVLYKFEKEGKL